MNFHVLTTVNLFLPHPGCQALIGEWDTGITCMDELLSERLWWRLLSGWKDGLDQWFSNFSMEDWQITDCWVLLPKFLILKVHKRSSEFALLTSSHVVLMLLVQKPCFENHQSRLFLTFISMLRL